MEDLNFEYLIEAIIAQAAEDYRKWAPKLYQHKDERFRPLVEEVEEFFRSEWYERLSETDGRYILKNLQKECKGA